MGHTMRLTARREMLVSIRQRYLAANRTEKQISHRIGAMYARIDTVEQGIRKLCNFKVTGYRLQVTG